MDGVLCDFLKRFVELYRVQPERDYQSKTKAKEEYRNRFKEFISNGHFATLDKMHDFDTGVAFLSNIEDDYTLKLLSSTAHLDNYDAVSSQKEHWLSEYGISYPAIFVAGKKLKQQYATPDSLLIDDTLSNIEEWREKGGHAIHHKTWVETIAEFKDKYI